MAWPWHDGALLELSQVTLDGLSSPQPERVGVDTRPVDDGRLMGIYKARISFDGFYFIYLNFGFIFKFNIMYIVSLLICCNYVILENFYKLGGDSK